MINLKESIKTEDLEGEVEGEVEENKSSDKTDDASNLQVETELEEKVEEIEITIESGLTLTNVATKLYDAGIIEDKDAFISFVRNKKLQRKIIYGKYKLKNNSTYDELIEMLTFRP